MRITLTAMKSLSQTLNGKFLVAGHLCLDITPSLDGDGLLEPGGILSAGQLHVSTGGAVPNVGSALMRLGYKVQLVARVGDDWLGKLCIELLERLGPQLAVRVMPGQDTSYSIVIASRNHDRTFLHCAGVNTSFVSADVSDNDIDDAVWMHVGYPPVLRAMAADGGRELAELFARASRRGVGTSLDFCALDPSDAPVDWEAVLRNCARFVTVFAPSLDELRMALGSVPKPDGDCVDVPHLARRLLEFGFSIVAIKLGANGLYLATATSHASLEKWGLGASWRGRELVAPSFRSNFVNASGAGDCAIAGLISAIAEGCDPERALIRAAAVGAYSTEADDASSGVRSIAELEARIRDGWPRLVSRPPAAGWSFDPVSNLWAPATVPSSKSDQQCKEEKSL